MDKMEDDMFLRCIESNMLSDLTLQVGFCVSFVCCETFFLGLDINFWNVYDFWNVLSWNIELF